MKIAELWELLPDYEPNPPLQFMPPQARNRFDTFGIVGDGSFRWCACRVFQVYLGSGKFETLVRPGETVSPEPLWVCNAVTRGYFHKNHQKLILTRLSKAEGYGYMCCLTHDQTPRKPFEVAELFGLRVHPVDITHAENTRAAVARRGQRRKLLAEGPTKAAATAMADSINRLL